MNKLVRMIIASLPIEQQIAIAEREAKLLAREYRIAKDALRQHESSVFDFDRCDQSLNS